MRKTVSSKLLDIENSITSVEERVRLIEDKMATKSDISHILGALDGITTIVKRIDEESVFTNRRIIRIEEYIYGKRT